MERKNRLNRLYIRILSTLFIIITFFSIAKVSYAASDIPSKVYSYFTDDKYNYEKHDFEKNITEKSEVYQVYYQQNRDGSAFIDVFYVKEKSYVANDGKYVVERDWLCAISVITYKSDSFDVYSSSAPWAIIQFVSHKDDGDTYITDLTDNYNTVNYAPEATPTSIPTPTPTATVTPSPSGGTGSETIATPSCEPSYSPVMSFTPYPSITPTATNTHAPTHTATPEPTATTILTTEPIEPTDIPEFYKELENEKKKDETISFLLIALMLLLIITLIIFVLRQRAINKEESEYYK